MPALLRNLRSERAAWQALGQALAEHAESLRELRADMPIDRSQTALQGR